MNIFLIIAHSYLFCVICGQTVGQYDNYQFYEILIENQQQLEMFRFMESHPDGYIFYSDYYSINSTVKVLVPPNKLKEFLATSNILRLNYSLLKKNFDTKPDRLSRRSVNYGWTTYHTLSQIYGWMDEMVARYPQVLTSIIGGHTSEGREIRGVKLAHSKQLPIIVIDSNIHAREWITSTTTTWMINELVTSEAETVQRIVRTYEWHIFPVINPDGFEFSHTTDRLWRKSRSNTTDPKCPGVDLNRNWDYHYTTGASPCAQTYSGMGAFTEVETKSLADYYMGLNNILMYMSFHSFSQYIIIPYGHTTMHLDNYSDLLRIGTHAVKKMYEKYGTEYDIGSVPEFIHGIATGASADWMKGVLKVPITYTFELRDKGLHGFELPTSQIIPTAEETFDAVMVIIMESEKMGYRQPNKTATGK